MAAWVKIRPQIPVPPMRRMWNLFEGIAIENVASSVLKE
jgi:hypothetical protein